MANTAGTILSALVASLVACTSGRVISECGDTHTTVYDLSPTGRVQIGTDPGEASGLAVSVHVGRKSTQEGRSKAIGSTRSVLELHVFGAVPADSDTSGARVLAALQLEADICACLSDDRRTQARLGAVTNLLAISVESSVMDGGSSFENRAALYLIVRVTWDSFTGA